MIVHYTHAYLLAPMHKVTVDLVGVGGTGSQVLTNLARMNEALMSLNHPGLHVRAWDADIVSPANMGRQLYSPADLNQNKAIVLVTRVNRFFGYEWEAKTELYGKNSSLDNQSNILITCVDTAAMRIKISQLRRHIKTHSPVNEPYYWLDIGNLQKTGQCILGTLQDISQPKSEHRRKFVLPDIIKKFPQLKKIKEEDQGPSCSLAEALQKQDLFINSTLAQFGCNLLWKLFKEGMIKYHGCYVNLETLSVNPIKIN